MASYEPTYRRSSIMHNFADEATVIQEVLIEKIKNTKNFIQNQYKLKL